MRVEGCHQPLRLQCMTSLSAPQTAELSDEKVNWITYLVVKT
ncbi:hypothetical protein CVCC1112_1191 [Paenarthrobacter nicotinovorans]|nr:hypothetical protein ANMWB30_12310 [Arthrobacter sp. MWB30]GAT86530.1 hypothetical protein CVCC1112_1191 [Paenarthrobacter nicotinovorans]